MTDFGRIAADCLVLRAALPEPLRARFDRVSEAALKHALTAARDELREVEQGPLAPVLAFPCDPDESGGLADDDPKHPEFHSLRAELWDNRAGK